MCAKKLKREEKARKRSLQLTEKSAVVEVDRTFYHRLFFKILTLRYFWHEQLFQFLAQFSCFFPCFSILHEKCWKSRIRPTFGVRSNLTLVKIYNKQEGKSYSLKQKRLSHWQKSIQSRTILILFHLNINKLAQFNIKKFILD